MTETIWQVIYQVAFVLVALLAGGAAVGVIGWLKTLLRADGTGTLAIVALVSVVLTLATMVVEGFLLPGAITLENFGTIFVTVFVATQVRYRQLRDELRDEMKAGKA